MSITGIGLKLAVMTMFYSILIFGLNDYYKIAFAINVIPHIVLIVIGAALLAVGIPFLIISIISIYKAYTMDFLCVTGIYSICRNPLYSAWIVFIIPGITLLLGSWILLSIPFVMYLIFRILIKQEESYLFIKFGEQYTDYKTKVSLLFPMFWRYNKNKTNKKGEQNEK